MYDTGDEDELSSELRAEVYWRKMVMVVELEEGGVFRWSLHERRHMSVSLPRVSSVSIWASPIFYIHLSDSCSALYLFLDVPYLLPGVTKSQPAERTDTVQ